tara:strand:+ start:516 stop:905 length:390 start_codon:yes stop_codon:yes gene_type:complete
MKNQLFRVSPDIQFIEKLLSKFGIKDLSDNHSFTRSNLLDLRTVEQMNNMLNELNKYYLPCKSKKYLVDLNEKKCITVLRQFLKSQNHTLISKEKYINGIKNLFYQVIPIQINLSTKNRSLEKVILSFD